MPAEVAARFARASPAAIGAFRHWGFMDPGVQSMQANVRIAGPAVTIHQPSVDGEIIRHTLGQLRRGDVLVVDRCGDGRHAGFGGIFAHAAKIAAIAGLIVDGVVADVAELRHYRIPVWSRGLSAITVKRIGGLGGSLCLPVSCGGVAVSPGDVVIADDCGVVVIDAREAVATVERAIALQAAELG